MRFRYKWGWQKEGRFGWKAPPSQGFESPLLLQNIHYSFESLRSISICLLSCLSRCRWRSLTRRHCQKLLKELPEPKAVWKYMLALTQIPRGSNKRGETVNNKRVTAFLKERAEELGCETYVDKGENLIIRKKATPGAICVSTMIRRIRGQACHLLPGTHGYGLPEG